MRRNRDFVNNQINGPLMTDHLRDLDMELELLKRKREILQQEQNMITRIARQNNYEQPSSSFRHEHIQFQPQQVDVANFADLFEAQGGSRNFRQSLKRQNQSNWQASNPPKRFNAPRAVNPWQDDSAQGQRKNFQNPKNRFSPAPLMSIKPGISQRLKRENPNPRRDFQPSKITKSNQRSKKDNQSKARAQQAKIVNYPANEAKNLVSEAKKTIEPKNSDQILHADREPSLQMKGRMELALGSILKEIRLELANEPDVTEYFATIYIQRIVKRMIRSRIRDVMMGKAIGTINHILDNYRSIYPKETDFDIIRTVKEAQAYCSKNLSVAHLIESDDPQDFFTKNMTLVLSNKLDDLFTNIQTFYENKDKQIIDSINRLPEPAKTVNIKEADDNEKVNLTLILNNFFDSVPEQKELMKALGGRIDKAKHYIDFMDTLIEERLPRVLPKFKDAILNILHHDREFIGTKAMVISEMKKKAKNNKEPVEQKVNEVEITEDKSEKIEVEMTEDKSQKIDVKSIEPVKDINDKISDNAAVEKQQTYYVKLVGRPKLPARSEICDFLNQFNTKSIKKHKTINNLLVLTFTNKVDLNRILAANETVVGDATLIIKASEQVLSNKEVNQNSSEKKDDSDKSLEKKDDSDKSKEKKVDSDKSKERKDDSDNSTEKKDDSNKCSEMKDDSDNSTEKKDDSDKSFEKKDDSDNSFDKEDEHNSSDKSEILNDCLIPKDLDNQISDLLSSIRNGDEDICSNSNDIENDNKVSVSDESPELTVKMEVSDEVSGCNDKVKSNDNRENTLKVDVDINSKGDDSKKDSEHKDKVGNNELAEHNDNMEINDKNSKNNDKVDAAEAVCEDDKLDAINETHENDNNQTDTDCMEKGEVMLDKVEELKGKSCETKQPTRFSSRLANTPSKITTRRASRLAQNNS